MAAPLFPALATAAVGGLATGFAGGLFGGGSSSSGGGGAVSPDYGGQAALYLAQISPYNTRLTAAAQELATMQAPYLGGVAAQQQVLGQGQFDIFDAAKQKDLAESNLRLGIAQAYSLGAADTLLKDAQNRQTLELMGAQTQSDIAKAYANAAYGLQNSILTGEQALQQPTATGLASAGLSALQSKNQLAQNLATTNLNLRSMEADTQNKLALIRGDVEGKLALKRFEAGLAGATHGALA
jgi:hypothetical protein